MKRIATVTALILIFALCACGGAYSQSRAGFFTLLANYFTGQPIAGALSLLAAAVYYLLVLILVNTV